MSRKTKLSTIAYVYLIVLISCHGQHDKSQHRNSHFHKSEIKSTKNLKRETTMKIKKPNRISHTYNQTIDGIVKEIMPLYCPVRELDWCENWNPKAVYSNSGLVEKDCIFITSHGEEDVVWIVSAYDVEKGYVEMFYHVPRVLVTKLEIRVTQVDESKTNVVLIYSKTSLSELGDKVLKEFTKEAYDIMMDSWEKAMNHYIKTGKMLTGLPNF